MIGSGRTKIETPQQFSKALATVTKLELDGLIVVGGDDSNTNAALLAEFFKKERCRTKVSYVHVVFGMYVHVMVCRASCCVSYLT